MSAPEQGLSLSTSLSGPEGQRGSWGKGQHWWEGAGPAPAATEKLRRGGGALADFQLPPLCPSLWLSQKELSVLLQHSRPERRTYGWGREEQGEEGGVLASFFFFAWAVTGPKSLQAPGCKA